MGVDSAMHSFGRGRDRPRQDPVVLVPPLQLTQVQVPLVLVLDPQALQLAAGQVEAMIREAVLRGFDGAVQDLGGQAEQPAADTRPENL